jgi:hypothetical protein
LSCSASSIFIPATRIFCLGVTTKYVSKLLNLKYNIKGQKRFHGTTQKDWQNYKLSFLIAWFLFQMSTLFCCNTTAYGTVDGAPAFQSAATHFTH